MQSENGVSGIVVEKKTSDEVKRLLRELRKQLVDLENGHAATQANAVRAGRTLSQLRAALASITELHITDPKHAEVDHHART